MTIPYEEQSAFACPADHISVGSGGLSIREYFIAAAMQGVAASRGFCSADDVARWAVAIADATIAKAKLDYYGDAK